MARLYAANFKNTYTVFNNAGGATVPNPALEPYDPYHVSLQRRTTSSANSDAGEYLYYGYSMDEIGEWLMFFITCSLTGGPVRPYGGDTFFPNLTPKVLGTSIVRPYGYPGYLNDTGDILLNFPNLGAPGMMMEFDTNDAGIPAALDQEANGARSSVGYVTEGIPPVINAFYIMQSYDGLNNDGTLVAGIPLEKYADTLTQTAAGMQDYIYKGSVRYQGYDKGVRTANQGGGTSTIFRYASNLWNNVIDRPMEYINAINAAGSAGDIRAAIEDPLFALVLFQYNGLSEAGKDNVAGAILAETGAFVYYTIPYYS